MVGVSERIRVPLGMVPRATRPLPLPGMVCRANMELVSGAFGLIMELCSKEYLMVLSQMGYSIVSREKYSRFERVVETEKRAWKSGSKQVPNLIDGCMYYFTLDWLTLISESVLDER